MPDKAKSKLERQRRLLKALSRWRTPELSAGILARLLRRSRRRALLARLDAEWQAGFVLHDTGDLIFVPTPLDARGRHCLLYPPSLHGAVRAVLKAGSVAIDIGASLGEWAVPLARAVGPDGRLFAFEPQPLAARALEATLRINNLRQASVIEAAVSDRVGVQHLAVPDVTSSAVDTGRAHIGSIKPGETASSVRSVTLDTFIDEARLDRLDLVKIDVEGCERAVLDGARSTITRLRPVIVMETGHETAADRARIATMLCDAGYEIIGMLLDHGIAPASWEAYATATTPCIPGEIHNMLILPAARVQD